MTYAAPLAEIKRALTAAGYDELAAYPEFESATADVTVGILAEAAKLSENIFAPLNRTGDKTHAKLVAGKVVLPEGWSKAWAAVANGGWLGVAGASAFGGMGLPETMNLAVTEMFNAANLSFALAPLLTVGAAYAIGLYANEDQKQRFLPQLYAGTWSGTMNLTEPQAGSDLAALRTTAVPDGNHFRISGQKIFITYGEHEMTENILHLVLARLPDAPAGVKGISLFAVPKFVDGRPNALRAARLENKLGIGASPTCEMLYEGAVGEIIGQPHRGLEYMFAMMNHARLDVGMQGLAVATRAYQMAKAYAEERVQGKPVGFMAEGKATIIHHPDVRRLLVSMKARIAAMRGLLFEVAVTRDIAHADPDPARRAAAQAKADLLTPVAKGWCTELGNEVVNDALQVFGGMGFVEDTGIAQLYRDARILPIYEGTTAIQSNALVGRGLLRDGGKTFATWLQTLSGDLAGPSAALRASAEWLVQNNARDPRLPFSGAVNFLHQVGWVAGAQVLAKQGDAPLTAFYNTHILPRAGAMHHAITRGSDTVFAVEL